MRGDGLGGGQHQHGEHRTPADTRRITTERLRSVGVSKNEAARTAEKVAREVHERK